MIGGGIVYGNSLSFLKELNQVAWTADLTNENGLVEGPD